MLTRLMKDIVGAVFMALGIVFTLLCAAVGCISVVEESTDSEFTLVPKEDKKPTKK